MLNAVKEMIIMLLVCLVGILLFAVVFYEYIPSRKIVAEVQTYTASSEVEELLADDIDQIDNDVILTFQEGSYSVTSTDLNNYEASDDYVAGRSNPFATVVDDTEDETDESSTVTNSTNTTSSESTDTSTNTSTSASTSTETNTTSTSNTNTTSTEEEFFTDTGTK